MPRKPPVVLPPPTGEKICCFCGLKDDNELDYGKFYEYDGIITHYYCLLLSSNMQQQGRDDEGILGFLPEDINKELRRGRKLACCYCKKMGATLGCCNTKCKKIFHFPCGLKSGSLHQFFGEFRSYCKNHRPKQNIDERIVKEVSQRENMICYICYDDVNPDDMIGTLWAPCCKKNAWFHRTCVQQLAMSAGYFFKCPLCNNKLEFQRAMLDCGIFIPSQDASWELVPNAFQELLYRHNRCDAVKCLCPKGRSHTSTNARWELTLCRTCGSQGIHMACGNLKWVKPIWECSECISILNKSLTAGNSEMNAVLRSSTRGRDRALLTDDESSNDSDISVGSPETPMETGISSSSESSTSSMVLRSTANCSSSNNHRISEDDRNMENEDSHESNITTSHVNNEIRQQNNDELPPMTKRPRISDSFVDGTEHNGIDSDDDVIVLSGPSNMEKTNPATNGIQYSANSVHRSSDNSWEFINVTNNKESNKQINRQDRQEEFTKTDKQEIDSVEKVCRQVSEIESSNKSLMDVSNRSSTSGMEKRAPVEIDLSDSESITTEQPELNIIISNVTSLTPEVFASVPEFKNDSHNDTIERSRVSNLVGSSVNEANCPRQQTHEKLTIVRFDDTGSLANPLKSVFYGLTIPGTNNTVPLTLAPRGKSETPMTSRNFEEILHKSTLNPSLSDNCEPPALIYKPGPKSRKAEIARLASLKRDSTFSNTPIAVAQAIKSNSAKQPETIDVEPKMSYSVPLEAVLNENILLSLPSGRSGNRASSYDHASSFAKIKGQSKKRTESSSSEANISNTKNENSSPVKKPSIPIVSPDTAVSNGVTSNPVSQNSAFVQNDPSSPKKTDSYPSNGLLTSRFPQIGRQISSQIIYQPSQIGQQIVAPTASQIPLPTPSQFVPPTAFKVVPQIASEISSEFPSYPVGQYNNIVPINNDFLKVKSVFTKEMYSNVHGTLACVNPPLAFVNDNVTDYGASMNFQHEKKSSIDNDIGLYIIPTESNNQATSENCDGDAGSGSADQPTSVLARNTKTKRNVTASPRRCVTVPDNRDWSNANRKNESKKYEARNGDVASDHSTPSERNTASDRTRLIDKTINLRDLKFTVFGPNIVKMTIYETYSVNMNIDTANKYNYAQLERSNLSKGNSTDSFVRRTKRSSRTRGNDDSRNVNSNSKNLPDSPTNDSKTRTIGNDDDEVLNESDSNSRSNCATEESEIPLNEPSRDETNSRVQDELKENRDPVPSFTNLGNNTTGASERKSKTRLRNGNKTMQSFNERETQAAIDDENEKSARKSSKAANHSKIAYNGWKDNGCLVNRTLFTSKDEETLTPSVSSNRGNENGNCEISDHCETALKRPKYTNDENFRESDNRDKLIVNGDTNNDSLTTISHHLVSKSERSQSRRSARFFQTEMMLHVNNKLNERMLGRNSDVTNDASICCKVSIDLTRIRAVLSRKLNVTKKSENREFHECTMCATSCENKNTAKHVFCSKSFQYEKPTKSRSFSNLSCQENSSVERYTRKWKSAENLCSSSSRSWRENSVNGFVDTFVIENKRRGCKRKTRSFEKHDCVR